uniref:Transthyretin-like family protein n=1 Tax=Panagrellus redivivus TaxID=6233 RepID=A0A7E4VIL7_PANRE
MWHQTMFLVLTLIFGTASGTNHLMFSRMQASIVCNEIGVDAKVEILAAGNNEADHDHLAVVWVKRGAFDGVIMRKDHPIFFLRVHYQCGNCPARRDLPFVYDNDQHWEWISAVNNPVNLGWIDMGKC